MGSFVRIFNGFVWFCFSYRYSWRLEQHTFHGMKAGYIFFLLFGIFCFDVHTQTDQSYNYIDPRIHLQISNYVRITHNNDSLLMGQKKSCCTSWLPRSHPPKSPIHLFLLPISGFYAEPHGYWPDIWDFCWTCFLLLQIYLS